MFSTTTSSPARPPVRAIAFDLDGTLVDSFPITFDAFNHGFSVCGRAPMTPQEIMSYFGPGEGQIFARMLTPEHAPEATAAFHRYLQDNVAGMRLHPGVDEMLQALWARKIPTAIVTGRGWKSTEVILRHHGILERFVTVIANDHVSQPKPSPEGILLAARRMGVPPGEIAYLGDSWVDIQAARDAGALSLAAAWDALADHNALKSRDPHHWLEAPLESLSIIGIS